MRRQRLGRYRTNPARENGSGTIDEVGPSLGLDVGESTRHGQGLTPVGKKVFDRQLSKSEPKLRAVCDKLAAKFDTVLVIGPARLHRSPASDRRPGRRLQGRPPARPVHAADRRSLPGRGCNQALLCLARQRTNVLFATFRDGTFYEPG